MCLFRFKIKSGVMVAGRTYVFSVTTFVSGFPSVNSSAEISVLAVASDLFAAIRFQLNNSLDNVSRFVLIGTFCLL